MNYSYDYILVQFTHIENAKSTIDESLSCYKPEYISILKSDIAN